MERIWVLEGLNGVGKSAIAKRLAARFNVPILRAFRHARTDVHLGRDGGGIQNRLRALGVPANTFVDEIYMADFLAATGVSAVLDRAIGSAIAYGLVDGSVKSVSHAQSVAAEWGSMVSRLDVVYVHIQASESERERRTAGRWNPGPVMSAKLEAWFDWVYEELVTCRKRRVDTTRCASADEALELILRTV